MRKNVLKIHIRHNRAGPRIGQDIREYYRNVTHLAKDFISKDIQEAWQIVNIFFEEDTEDYIRKHLPIVLRHLSNESICRDEYIVFKRHNTWYKRVDDAIEEIDSFELIEA